MSKFISDCRHMLWLFKQMTVSFIKGDMPDAIEAWYFIKIHWNYRSERIK